MFRKLFVSALIATAAMLVASAPASATTFCVPGYFAACPNSGGNVAQPDLQAAVATNGNDGVPDTIYVDTFTYVDAETLEPSGTDELKVIGSGTGNTVITSSSALSVYVMTAGFGERPLSLKDLSIVAPASFPDTGGAGLFIDSGILRNVNIESKNLGLGLGLNAAGKVDYIGGRIFGSDGGTVEGAVQTYGSEPGQLTLDGVGIEGANLGIYLTDPDQPVTFRNGRITGTRAGVSAQILGSDLTFVNSVIEAGANSGMSMGSAVADVTHLNIESSTVVSAGHPAAKAISGSVTNGAGQDSIRVKVRNSIFRDFDSTYAFSAPNNSPLGDTFISFEYSNFNLLGTQTGDGTAYVPPSNFNQNPLFSAAGDYSLSPGSPSIDAGDPDGSLDPAFAINGTIRPLDGNADGKEIQDQGAYEYSPVTCPPANSCNPNDKTPPTISKVKFRKPNVKKGAFVSLTLSEAAKVRLTFKPLGKSKPRRKSVKLTRAGKAGANRIKVKKGRLKAGKYRLSISATDANGNKSKTLVRKVSA